MSSNTCLMYTQPKKWNHQGQPSVTPLPSTLNTSSSCHFTRCSMRKSPPVSVPFWPFPPSLPPPSPPTIFTVSLLRAPLGARGLSDVSEIGWGRQLLEVSSGILTCVTVHLYASVVRSCVCVCVSHCMCVCVCLCVCVCVCLCVCVCALENVMAHPYLQLARFERGQSVPELCISRVTKLDLRNPLVWNFVQMTVCVNMSLSFSPHLSKQVKRGGMHQFKKRCAYESQRGRVLERTSMNDRESRTERALARERGNSQMPHITIGSTCHTAFYRVFL